jgi:hypothetical protein
VLKQSVFPGHLSNVTILLASSISSVKEILIVIGKNMSENGFTSVGFLDAIAASRAATILKRITPHTGHTEDAIDMWPLWTRQLQSLILTFVDRSRPKGGQSVVQPGRVGTLASSAVICDSFHFSKPDELQGQKLLSVPVGIDGQIEFVLLMYTVP